MQNPHKPATPADDLQVGQFVAIVRRKIERKVQRGFFLLDAPPEDEDYSGVPLEILEISLPFIACSDGKNIAAIDLRAWEVRRVSRRYAEVFRATPAERAAKRGNGRRKKKEKLGPRSCPRCGERMIQRPIVNANPDLQGFHVICPACNHDGGRVAQ